MSVHQGSQRHSAHPKVKCQPTSPWQLRWVPSSCGPALFCWSPPLVFGPCPYGAAPWAPRCCGRSVCLPWALPVVLEVAVLSLSLPWASRPQIPILLLLYLHLTLPAPQHGLPQPSNTCGHQVRGHLVCRSSPSVICPSLGPCLEVGPSREALSQFHLPYTSWARPLPVTPTAAMAHAAIILTPALPRPHRAA